MGVVEEKNKKIGCIVLHRLGGVFCCKKIRKKNKLFCKICILHIKTKKEKICKKAR